LLVEDFFDDLTTPGFRPRPVSTRLFAMSPYSSPELPNDAPVLGYLGRVVGDSDFVVKEFAADVADESHELAGLVEKFSLAVQLTYSIRQGSQKSLEIARPTVVVGLLLLRHGTATPIDA
jgi:hypothetical protein